MGVRDNFQGILKRYADHIGHNATYRGEGGPVTAKMLRVSAPDGEAGEIFVWFEPKASKFPVRVFAEQLVNCECGNT